MMYFNDHMSSDLYIWPACMHACKHNNRTVHNAALMFPACFPLPPACVSITESNHINE